MSYPLVLPHHDVRRILERRATRLVRTARVKRGDYSVQDAFLVKRNERLRAGGRLEELSDPDVFAIQITDAVMIALIDVDYTTVRQCGFKAQRDFFDDWLLRKGRIDPYMSVWSVGFCRAEVPRYLHRRTFAGYTSNPRLAMFGEPEALSAEDLKHLAADGRARHERERREEVSRQHVRSISLRLRAAQREGRPDEVLALRVELERLADRMAPDRLGAA